MSARLLPPPLAAGLLRALLPLSRSWRFRHPDDPRRPIRPVLEPIVHAAWHEHLLPLACLFAGQGIATLASRDRDGEIVAGLLTRLGYRVARGSSTRGGSAGFRALLRESEAGQPVVLTPDGPAGPRRAVKEGAVRLAAASGRPLAAIGVAATAGWRLGSWDRFLVPAPGATVFVSIGPPAGAPDPAGVERALAREVGRAEQAASEARWARPPAIRRVSVEELVELAGETRRGRASRWAGAVETRVRRSWTRPRPPAALRAAGLAFRAAGAARNALYDRGWIDVRAGGLPVVSVGGVTVGGSGKSPLVPELAGWLADEGHRVAILARGYPDELALHKRRRPAATVWGHPDRSRLARRAAAEGATVALLDDGLQHRRLARDVEIVALDRDALRRTSGAPLPAGPFREPWRAALRRADLVVLTGREPRDAEVRAFEEGLLEEIARRNGSITLAVVGFETDGPRPANRRAREAGEAVPGLALTGIMKPNLFFASARARCPTLAVEVALPDHATPAAEEVPGLLEAAGEGGILTTEKDLPRLERAFRGVPLWVLPERLVWHAGREAARALLLRAVPGPARP